MYQWLGQFSIITVLPVLYLQQDTADARVFKFTAVISQLSKNVCCVCGVGSFNESKN